MLRDQRLQSLEQRHLRRKDLLLCRWHVEELGAVDLRELGLFPGADRPLHGKGVAADRGRIAVALVAPGVDNLAALLFDWLKRNKRAVRLETEFLTELALGGLQMDLSELLGRTVHLTLLGGIPASERSAVLARARMLDAA